MSDWGSSGIDSFISPLHSSIYPSIDPSLTTLSPGYIVCILGGSGVIGAGIAHAYAKAGASRIIIASRRVPELQVVAEECKALNNARESKRELQIDVVELDITSTPDFERLVKTIKGPNDAGGSLDAVIINSGYSGTVTLDVTENEMDTVKKVTEINYLGTYNAAHHLIPLLMSAPSPTTSTTASSITSTSTTPTKQKSFIAIGSNASLITRGPIANTQYCISKLAQLKLIEHIHEQYRSPRLTSSGHVAQLLAVAVHPGAVKTEHAIQTAPEEFMKFLTEEPGLVGAFCVWLCREGDGEGGGGGGEDTGDDDRRMWLGGRHLVAKWDVDALVARKEEIVTRDLLKVKLAL